MIVLDSSPSHRCLKLSHNEVLDSAQVAAFLHAEGYPPSIAEEKAAQLFDLLEEVAEYQHFVATA